MGNIRKELCITPWEMLVQFSTRKLKRSIEDDAEARKRFGKDMAKKIRLRLGALLAAGSLGDFWPPMSPPERCHELKGDLAGTFSMDLTHPYRLLFRPMNSQQEPHDETKDEGEQSDQKARWHSIDAIEVVAVEDTHG
jgi:plasmid maintenance system killer protein